VYWISDYSFTPGYDCLAEPGERDAEAECASSQGWCCIDPNVVSWKTQRRCRDLGGIVSLNPFADNACSLGRCCKPTWAGIIECEDVENTFNCARKGGYTLPSGSGSCSSSPCRVGVCTLPCNRCVDNVSESQCLRLGGHYGQDGTLCPPEIGACCLDEGGCRDGLTGARCQAEPGVYMGTGTLCVDQECQRGSCCLPTGECLRNQSVSECETQQGVFQGPWSCGSLSCPGACCRADLACEDGITLPNCSGAYDTYMGLGTICDDVTCPDPPTGACCHNRGRDCEDSMRETDCLQLAADAQYMGDDTTCSGGRCPSPDNGACCWPDWGHGTSCGNGFNQTTCESNGGTFMGYWTICDTVTCP